MTREELKEHCEKQVKMCEMWAKAKGEKPSGKVYEEHKLILELLEQEPCDDEYIKVPKKALKYRTAGIVAYNVEWLKNHFDTERTIICGAKMGV